MLWSCKWSLTGFGCFFIIHQIHKLQLTVAEPFRIRIMKYYLKNFSPVFFITLILVSSINMHSVKAAASTLIHQGSNDERRVEDARDEAIRGAVINVDPSLKAAVNANLIEGELGPNDGIEIEVERLRSERKKQFQNLTWSHVKSMINADTVLAKQKFLRTVEKNLKAVLDRAVEVYLPADIEHERIQLAKFKIAKAIRDLFPEAKITANIQSGSLTGASFLGDNWRAQFRQPIFHGGVLWNTLFMEWANLEIAHKSYDKAIADVVRDVSKAYFEYERAQNVLDEQKRLIDVVAEQKRISDEKVKAKIVSEIEQLNTDSLYSQVQYNRENAEQELQISILELAKFLKVESGDHFQVSHLYDLKEFDISALRKSSPVSMASGAQAETNLASLIDLAYQYRPDLQVEASKLKAAQLAYRVSLGERLPKIDALLEYGELAEAFINDLQGDAKPEHKHEFRVGMEVTWPLAGNTFKHTYDHNQKAPSVTQFLSGQGQRIRSNELSVGILDDLGQFSKMTQTKIENLEQVVQLEKTEREVIRGVKEAYFSFNKSLIQVESAYKRMGYREKLAMLAKHKLDNNEVQISEYLQSELDLVEERGIFFKALSDFFLSKAELNRAIGVRDYLTVDAIK